MTTENEVETQESDRLHRWVSRCPDDMDAECVKLCDAMNMIDGIKTVGSCCGHGKQEYRIWFVSKSLDDLPPLLYWFDGCHCSHYGWRVIVKTDCGMSPATFMVEGPTGAEAYRQAEEIADYIAQAANGAHEQPTPDKKR